MRGSGILLHISSIPSPYGIGTFGEDAFKFVDFLKGAGQKYWQILPLGPTSFGDSPYQSFSTFAGNPYFIDLDELCNENLLDKEDLSSISIVEDNTKVDFGLLYKERFPVFKKAFERFNVDCEDFKNFKKKNHVWIKDYSLFMALKKESEGTAWYEWENDIKLRDRESIDKAFERLDYDVEFWSFLQFKFFQQWYALKKYANENGILIIGDLPIYVAHDSCDVWANIQIFELDRNNNPINIAGCPPDDFSKAGQLWGNPLYNWDYLKKTNYSWWIQRLRSANALYDIIRIDHFKGFESYYSIPYTEKNALNGIWRKGPGIIFFDIVKRYMNKINIIAEDLGYLTKEAIDMRKATGFPGMKIIEFAFDTRDGSDYLPHNHEKNSVSYIGTHDNETALSWIDHMNLENKQYMMEYFDFDNSDSLVWKIIRKTFASVSDIVIIQMQDYLVLGNNARMNIPSTLGNNWLWRADLSCFSDDLKKSILETTKLYQR